MSGFFMMHRGWQDADVFGNAEYSERDAWCWLIENAAWRETTVRIKGETVAIERGQMSFAQRFLAEKWRWSKSRVDRFLKRLAMEGMISICSKNGATAGQGTGQGQSVLTICNYAKYQERREDERGNVETENGATAGQQRGKEEQIKQINKENTHYAFAGRLIKLTPADLERWRSQYHGIRDIEAQLSALDDWLIDQPAAEQAKWFHIVSGALNKKHQKALSDDSDELRMPVA